MVRRTGMFESPANVVSVQRIANPVGDTSPVWEALINGAQRANEMLQPLRNQNAANQAQRDFADGRVGLRLQLSAEDEIYNNAMTQSYLLAAERDIDQRALELETQFADDPEAFSEAFQAARAGFMESAPGDLAPHLDQLLQRRETEYVNRIGERRRNIAISAYAQNAAARLAQMEARLTGYDDIESPEFQAAFQEYDQAGAAISSNPLSGVTGEEWDYRRNNFFSRLSAQRVADQAVLMYQEGGGNAESAQQAIGFVEEAMRNPELVLTEAQRDASFNEARRSILRLEADRRRSERELAAQMRVLRAESNNEARDLIDGAQAMAQTFTVIPDDQMAELGAVVAASGSPARAREFNELQIANNVRRRLQGLSLSQIDGEMAALREAAQGGDTNAAQALIEAERYRSNLRRIDSVTGAQLHLGQEPAPLTQGIAPRIRQMESYAQSVGREEVEYFSPGEREMVAAELRRGGETAVQIIRGVVSQASNEPGNARLRASRILSELAGSAGPEFAAMGGVYMRGGDASNNTVRYMGAALEARQQEGYRREALMPANRTDGAEDDIIAEVLGEQAIASMDPGELAEVRLAADLMYEGRALSDPSLYETNRRYESAYRGAVQAVLGGVSRNVNGREYSFGGVADMGRPLSVGVGPVAERTMNNAVVVPNWMRRDQFATIYQSLNLSDFSSAGGGRVPSGGTVADWRNARLVPTGRRVGEYFLVDREGGGYMVGEGANRAPYVFDLNALRASLAERRPDAIAP